MTARKEVDGFVTTKKEVAWFFVTWRKKVSVLFLLIACK